jgi:hypothetical protein
MEPARTTWRRMIARVAALTAICSCGDGVRVDVCPRGDLAALTASLEGGELELLLRDETGVELARQPLGRAGKTFSSDAWDRTESIDVVGRDAEGTTRASGTSSVTGDVACVCLSRLQDAAAACANVSCVATGDACSFSDAAGTVLPPCRREAATPGSYRDLVLASQPLIYYRLEEPSGTVAVDAAGANDGNYRGTVALGRSGALAGETSSALEVSAIDSGVTMPLMEPWSADFTAELWFQRAQGPVSGSHVILIRERHMVRGFRFGYGTNGVLRFWCSESGCTSGDILGHTAMEAGTWHHLALSRRGSEIRMYVDGEQDAIGTADYIAQLASDPVAWGSSQGTPSQGRFDELAVYPRALSPGEIAAHYEAGASGMTLVCR